MNPPPAASSRRYVVLRHSGVDEPHFDFLFETADGSPLVTFRLAEWPISEPVEAIQLKDHRRAYLTFEGPIPGDRGRVDRMAEGTLNATRQGNAWRLTESSIGVVFVFEPQEVSGPQRPMSRWWARRESDLARFDA